MCNTQIACIREEIARKEARESKGEERAKTKFDRWQKKNKEFNTKTDMKTKTKKIEQDKRDANRKRRKKNENEQPEPPKTIVKTKVNTRKVDVRQYLLALINS